MRNRRLALPALLLLFSIACGSTAQRPAGVTRPEIDVDVVNEIFFGSSSTAPATLEVRVRNTSPHPITVRRIEISSTSMTEWGFPRQSRQYSEVVGPGDTKTINYFATAQTVTRRRSEPLSFEARVEFESQGTRWQEFVRIVSTRPPV